MRAYPAATPLEHRSHHVALNGIALPATLTKIGANTEPMKTILTVDDSPSIRQMVAFTLSGAGYNVVQAVDGVDGLTKARTTDADLVLTDQNMPNADGLTLIRGLRSLPKYAKTPILVLTTEAGDDMKAKGKAAGATGWIVKPFDPVTLLNVVKKVLG